MPNDISRTPTYWLTTSAVRWSIDTLGAQRLHPTFVMYLYLRVQQRAGKLAAASAKSDELLSLIQMPGHPTKPYYFPFIDRGKRTGKPLSTFWRAENISGSWSPGSIRRQQPSAWLASDEGAYVLPDNHVELARAQMLYSKPVSALAMGAFFLRNDGFVISSEPTAYDVLAGFRRKFDYPPDTDNELYPLFDTTASDVTFDWFEPVRDVDANAGRAWDA